LSDLGSANGTYLNGWRVSREIDVQPGDQVSFGDARFILDGPRN
jgi:pSer/pThr/pTyr-binding forkhead associated (FHA) protein